MIQLPVLVILALVLSLAFQCGAWSLPRPLMRLASVSLGFALGAPANADDKTDFVKAASTGSSIQRQLEKNLEKEKAVDSSASFTPQMSGVRLIDLGGNRGARGLAASTDVVSGGSLVDQLKAYGGPGQTEESGKVKLVDGKTIRIDNSIKNPLKYKNSVEDQLKVYGAVGGKR